MSDLIERLKSAAELCRSQAEDFIAGLLDEAATALPASATEGARVPALQKVAAELLDAWHNSRIMAAINSGSDVRLMFHELQRALAAPPADSAKALPAGAVVVAQALQRLNGVYRDLFDGDSLSEPEWMRTALRLAEQLTAAPLPSEPAAAEPIGYVPVHPKQGPLWMDSFAANAVGIEERRASSYPLMALYTAAPSPQQQGAWTREHHIALREAHCIESSRQFFEARPNPQQIHPVFDAGFCRGFDAAVEAMKGDRNA